MKHLGLVATSLVILSTASVAQDYLPPRQDCFGRQLMMEGEPLIIPPYRHIFHVRLSGLSRGQPIYNVPPHAVVTAY